MALPPYFLTFAALGLLGACATPPLAMDATNPASPDAPEGAARAARANLRADANTLRTRELLAHREQDAAAAEAETPAEQDKPGPQAIDPQEGRP